MVVFSRTNAQPQARWVGCVGCVAAVGQLVSGPRRRNVFVAIESTMKTVDAVVYWW